MAIEIKNLPLIVTNKGSWADKELGTLYNQGWKFSSPPVFIEIISIGNGERGYMFLFCLIRETK